eukprot:6390195-Amphidinium_carterae.1
MPLAPFPLRRMCVRSPFCFALQCPLRRRECAGNHSHRQTHGQNHSITAGAEFPFTVTKIWEALKAAWFCESAEAVFDQGLVDLLFWSSSLPFSCYIQGQVRLAPSRNSSSANQPPPLPLQVHYFAISHDQGSAHVSELHSPAVAEVTTLQCTCSTV